MEGAERANGRGGGPGVRLAGDVGLGWAGICGGEAVRLGRAGTQGVWADVCIARLTWFLWRPLAR